MYRTGLGALGAAALAIVMMPSIGMAAAGGAAAQHGSVSGQQAVLKVGFVHRDKDKTKVKRKYYRKKAHKTKYRGIEYWFRWHRR